MPTAKEWVVILAIVAITCFVFGGLCVMYAVASPYSQRLGPRAEFASQFSLLLVGLMGLIAGTLITVSTSGSSKSVSGPAILVSALAGWVLAYVFEHWLRKKLAR